MRGSPVGIRIFRFLLILAAVAVCLNAPPRVQTILLAITSCLGLWIFSSLCLDAKAIRKTLEESEKQPVIVQGFQPETETGGRSQSPSLFEGVAVRKLGDRVFKADESKTCKTCQSFEPEGPACGLDGESLAGITLSAVGCQHWSPGLKVAGKPSGEET
jgi:hypothetical protein